MKKFLLATTILGLAALSGSAMAADPTAPSAEGPFSAVLDGWVGGYFISGASGNVGPDETSMLDFGGDLRARMNLGDIIAIQGDASIERTDNTDATDQFEKGWHVGGHLSLYNDAWLIGIMGATGEGDSDNETTKSWLLGGEGQMYLDQATLYLQAGYFDGKAEGNPDEDAFHDAIFVRGVGRYFLSPETRLQAELSGAWGEQDSDDQNTDIYGWGVRADHQFTDMMSGFVGYQGAYYDNGSGGDTGDYIDHQVRAGFSILLGRPDLMSVDRSGPTLDMPWLGHWAASGQILD